MLTSTTRAFGSPSRYIQGYGELERLQDYTADYGKKVLAIIDPFFLRHPFPIPEGSL
ncbi:hypothetical protein [Eubacterium callanderi]|uniref:hypothetical protein n=1 Tax=Eubacterium callanderi TaxID=53442 RepID=UPI001D15D47D|nr:hypothetical protein [Eubacterium callanderi]